MNKLSTRVAADNIPEDIQMRLIGAAERDMVSMSAIVRKALDESLPPLKQVTKFYLRAVQTSRN